ncbi:MAG TPA: hypothetical protein VF062_21540 [Candidatus Limnocylindrales bacterium]
MRLFEFKADTQALPANLAIAVGDVLRFAASGGRVVAGTAVESLGAFVRGTVATDGSTLSPQGPPGTMLFRAVAPGAAAIELALGSPFGQGGGTARRTARIEVTVEG